MTEKVKSSVGQLQLSLDGERQVFRVSELNGAIQKIFLRSFTQIWVTGEISGARMATSGHHYFCLKDKTSQLKCVLFKNAARLTNVKPQDGLTVLLQGSLEIYQPRGEYQFIIERLELQGAGSLQLAFERMKARLAAEGLFQQERKRPLPRFPQRIGLITSSGGAALHDILQILSRRFPGLNIRLYPSPVQGEGSVEQLCAAIDHFSSSHWAEVVIVARGGGSLEDLWSFNDERLARAMAASSVPIISAVGHETDFTIADFVADHRAPTPSAAAEIVICTQESLLAQFDSFRSRMTRGLRYGLALLSREVNIRGGDRGNAIIRQAISRRMQQVDEADQCLVRSVDKRLASLSRKLNELGRRLHDANLPLRFSRNKHRQEVLTQQLAKGWSVAYWQYQERLVISTSHLVQLSPLAVLARGYAIVETFSHPVLRSAEETSPDEELLIHLHFGRLKAIVTNTQPTDNPTPL